MKKKLINGAGKKKKPKITCFISQNVYNLAVVFFPLGGSQWEWLLRLTVK